MSQDTFHTIQRALALQEQQILQKLAQLTPLIAKKDQGIARLKEYLQHYHQRCLEAPAHHAQSLQNYQHFSDKIMYTMHEEQAAREKLIVSRDSLLMSLQQHKQQQTVVEEQIAHRKKQAKKQQEKKEDAGGVHGTLM